MNIPPKFEIVTPTDLENDVLANLDDISISEMTQNERSFLNALILRNKPKKILELGVSAGGSAIIILNAIKEFKDSKLYSIDLLDVVWNNANKKTGYFVDNYPSLKNKWELFTGGLALNFIEEIGCGIDFCLIDTAHSNPGEILDVLMVLPFIEKDAIIVFHDIALHTCNLPNLKDAITNNLLMSSITGKKIIMDNTQSNNFPNIAAIKINKDTKENIYEIFNLLLLKWSYLPSEEHEKQIICHFAKYYDKYYIDYLSEVFKYQRKNMRKNLLYKLKGIVRETLGLKNTIRLQKILGRIK